MHAMLNVAAKAARQAGDIIARQMGRLDSIKVEIKQQNDFVTEVDKAAEEAIIEALQKAYPDHAILAEESGLHGDENAEYQWIIDPLDGTTNYVHGFPQFAVSIALKKGNALEHACIYNPLSQEQFTASRGKGAFLNNRRIRVSHRNKLAGALLGTGFPIKQPQLMDSYIKTFHKLCLETAGIRRAGAATLDLAYVACGRLDGFWEMGLKPWDMAAGALLVREAGGFVTDFDGGEDFMKSGDIIAAPPKLTAALIQAINTTK